MQYNEAGTLMALIFVGTLLFLFIHGIGVFLDRHGIDLCSGINISYGDCAR